MVLGAGLKTPDGCRHEMLGMLGLETSLATRELHLGYRYAVSPSGDRAYGHEFHYAKVLKNPDPPFAEIRDAGGNCVADQGARRGPVTGTFFHLIDGE